MRSAHTPTSLARQSAMATADELASRVERANRLAHEPAYLYGLS
jgi:hypothetical protein